MARRKRSKKALSRVYEEAMNAAWLVVKKYNLNWTETLGCFEFMSEAFAALMMEAAAVKKVENGDGAAIGKPLEN